MTPPEYLTPGEMVIAIIEEVSKKHGFTRSAMWKKYSHGKRCRARYELFHRLNMEVGLAYAAIGRKFGVHHTTVLAGARLHRGLPPRAAMR